MVEIEREAAQNVGARLEGEVKRVTGQALITQYIVCLGFFRGGAGAGTRGLSLAHPMSQGFIDSIPDTVNSNLPSSIRR